MSFSEYLETFRLGKIILDGGSFFWILFGLSLFSITIIFYKSFSLKDSRILPKDLVEKLESLKRGNELDRNEILASQKRNSTTALGQICNVALQGRKNYLHSEIESVAKEEIVKMHSGLIFLEMIAMIAPLLGLLGTASGLVLVFFHFDSSEGIHMVSRGISKALYTTILGLIVAMPAMIAHGYFLRKIEKMTSKMESLITTFANVLVENRK